MNQILSFITGAVLSVGSFFGIYHPPVEAPALGSATTINLAGTFPYFLAGSGISSSATSIVLTSFTLPQNSYPIQDADLDATFYLTIEPGNRTKQEFVSCTTVGTNTGGTVTLSGCTRGLSPITPYTASSTLKFVHSGGSTVILSNPPQIYNDIYNYVNTISSNGAVTASEAVKGISELATAAEQAASTETGASGPLVLQSKYATSTYNSATAANKTVVTGSGGLIDPKFVFNGVTQTFPSTQASASSTVLVNDGNGSLTWNLPTSRILSLSNPATTTGALATTTLYTIAVPANTVTAGRNTLRLTSNWSNLDMSGPTCYTSVDFGNGTASTTIGSSPSFNQGRVATIRNEFHATSSSSGVWTSSAPIYGAPTSGFTSNQNFTGTRFITTSLAGITYLGFKANLSADGAQTCKLDSVSLEILTSP